MNLTHQMTLGKDSCEYWQPVGNTLQLEGFFKAAFPLLYWNTATTWKKR